MFCFIYLVCVCVLIIKAFFPFFHVAKMAMIQGEKCTAFNVYCRVSVVLLKQIRRFGCVMWGPGAGTLK